MTGEEKLILVSYNVTAALIAITQLEDYLFVQHWQHRMGM